MSMKLASIAIVIVLMSASYGCASNTAAGEPEPTPSAVVSQGNNERDPDEVICKRLKKTGSNRTEKVCATRRQWEEHESSQKELHDIAWETD